MAAGGRAHRLAACGCCAPPAGITEWSATTLTGTRLREDWGADSCMYECPGPTSLLFLMSTMKLKCFKKLAPRMGKATAACKKDHMKLCWPLLTVLTWRPQQEMGDLSAATLQYLGQKVELLTGVG